MNEVLDKYQEAIHYFNQNDFVKAEELFIELLKENQNDFDALNYVGIINLHNRRFEEAAKYFQKAYELNPLHSVTLYNLGLANQYLREYEKAETNYKTLLELEPEHIDGLNNLGLINLHKENFDEAEKLFLDVLKLEHEHNETLINLGNLKFEQEKYDEAISHYTRVLESDSQNLLCIYNLGNAYLKKEDYDLAVQYFDYTIKLDPNHTGAMNNLGIINTKKKKYEKAEGFYKKVLKLSPGNYKTMFNLAQCFEENSKYLEAANIYNSLLKLEPQNNAVILNLVGINYKLGNKSFSNELMNKVANDDSTKFALITNLGISKMRLGKVDDAIELWYKALEIDPNSPDANYNLGHANLLKGNFVEGWKGYEWRKKRKNFIELKFHEPELTNQDVNGKTILVYDEQGLGDSIQFVRYLQLLKEKGAKIIYAYDKRLAQIFKNITWIDYHLPRQNFDGENLSFDYHISLLSLPLYFKTNIKTIPSNIPYIFADRSVVKQLSPIIRKNKKFNIGIVWAGNPNNTNDKYRSSSLSEFSHLFSIDGVQLYSMQKGFGLEQLEQENLPIVNLEKHGINSFAHNMEIIENLDLVISVDTSIAHLVGAMGKPVWIILPFLPDWRWMLNRSDTPWYPTMKLFRQKIAGDWKGVFNEVANELQKLIDVKLSNEIKPVETSIENSLIHSSPDSIIQPFIDSCMQKEISNDAGNISRRIYLGLASGENFGWGVCSKYLGKELPKFCSIENIDQYFPAEKKVPGFLFSALTDINFNPLFPQRGEINVGYTFFEDSLTQKSIENAKKYNLIFAGSSWCKNKMLESGIYNTDILIQGIDPELFQYREPKEEENLFIVFSGGKFELRKGHDLVLKALKVLQSKYKDIVLINSWYNHFPHSLKTMKDSKHINFELINGSWEEQMGHVYKINGLDLSRIITLPIVPRDKLLDVYAKTDIGIFPNRCEGGTNHVLMEYMASGRPVIASYSSGHTDIINNENSLMLTDLKEYNIYENGRLSAEWEEASVEEIVENIEYAYNNRSLLKNLGKKAAEDMEYFTWNNAAKYLYERIIKL